MSPVDLTPILKDYEGKWVALSSDNTTVCGVGDNAQTAVEDAESKGHKDYTLLFVRPFNFLYSGAAQPDP